MNFKLKKNIIVLTVSYLICSISQAATYGDTIDKNGVISSDFQSIVRQVLNDSFLNDSQQLDSELKKENYIKVFELIKQNKLIEAKNELEIIIEQDSKEPEFFNLKALIAILEKKSSQAYANYRKAIELDGRNIKAHLGLATYALEIKDLKAAKKHAKIALNIDNQLAPAYLVLADVANKEININESEKILLAALATVKGNAKSELKIVTTLVKLYAFQQKAKKILDLGQRIQQQYPDNLEALSILANAQLINKQNVLAEQTLSRIINQDNQDTEHRILLANLIKTQKNKETQVIQLLDDVANIERNNPRALVYKASYLIQLKRYKEVLDIASKISKRFPKLAIGKMLEADVHLVQKEFDKALDVNLKAYQIQPNAKLLSIIVTLMNQQGQQAKAIEFVKQALVKTPDNSGLHFKLATLYQSNNDLEQAVYHYKSVLKQTPEHAITLNNLAWIYALQDNNEALKIVKQAYAINPKSASILDTYGYILVKHGQNKEAINILQKAVKLAPKLQDIQFHLAQAYSANGDIKQAIQILALITEQKKSFSEKQLAIKLLGQLKEK